MKILAHRGASAVATENTIEAFEAARRAGADGIELDVRRCGSGEVVVFHDATLERLGGVSGAVADLSLARLREVRLPGGARIPTLDEALETIGAGMEVHVELKVEDLSPTGLEAAVAEVLTRQGPDRRVIVSCFHPVGLWRLRRHAPHLPRALLFGTEQRWIWRHGWQGLGLRLSALHPEHGLVTPAAVARWHRRGLRVRAWTVDDPVRVRALAQAGADAIITNEPAAARRALERAGPAMP